LSLRLTRPALEFILSVVRKLKMDDVSHADDAFHGSINVGIDGICASCPICVAEPYHCIIQQLLVRPICV
jgi:hypothetical protein